MDLAALAEGAGVVGDLGSLELRRAGRVTSFWLLRPVEKLTRGEGRREGEGLNPGFGAALSAVVLVWDRILGSQAHALVTQECDWLPLRIPIAGNPACWDDTV